jgi:hypothetical protein
MDTVGLLMAGWEFMTLDFKANHVLWCDTLQYGWKPSSVSDKHTASIFKKREGEREPSSIQDLVCFFLACHTVSP